MHIPKFHNKAERNDFYTKSVMLVIFCVMFFYLLIPLIHSPRVEHFVANAGILGPLLLGLFFVLADITLPLFGSPGIILSVSLYGLWEGLWIAYIASLVSAAVNFYLSRRYGRSLIKKLSGKHGLEQVEFYTERFGLRTLIIGRLFGFPIFEIISYAGGLSNMSFRKYILITAIFAAVPAFTIKMIIFFANSQSTTSIFIWTCILSLVGAICAYSTSKVIDYWGLDKFQNDIPKINE